MEGKVEAKVTRGISNPGYFRLNLNLNLGLSLQISWQG